MMNLKYFGIALGLLTALVGCTSIPKGLKPVSNFDVERYLGTWYEIARLDHSFEKNLTNVSADYAQNEDGTISVTNRGYNTKKAEWKDIQGKAKFIGNEFSLPGAWSPIISALPAASVTHSSLPRLSSSPVPELASAEK